MGAPRIIGVTLMQVASIHQVELLLEIEESLPSFILKRVQVDEHVEYPNRKPTLRTKVRNLKFNRTVAYIRLANENFVSLYQIKEKIIGFGQAASRKEDDDDDIPPGLVHIIDRIQEQENRYKQVWY